MSLRAKIYTLILLMSSIAIVGGLTMCWYTYRMNHILSTIIDTEFVSYKATQDMQMALANQKGFLTYYFIDGQSKWLEDLGSYRQRFRQKLDKAYSYAKSQEQETVLKQIESKYKGYIAEKDKVIHNYKYEDRDKISKLHREQRELFFSLLEQCEDYKHLQWQRIQEKKALNKRQAEKLRLVSGMSVFAFLCLISVLSAIMLRQILDPIRTLALETGGDQTDSSKNEVKTLSSSLRTFMEDFDYTHSELTKSREHLEQAEKMALVGKLAAGVAHSIRNPFTSVKMRLFSLNRGLDLNEDQKEDFEVISEEIGRIDNIVQNFLEFARPPKLRMQSCHVDDVIANVLQLLRHRLHAYNIEVNEANQGDLPLIYADPEQLKEVLINLIINACEAIGDNGLIDISREQQRDETFGQVMVIRIQDNGPGVPEELQDKIFQPFFTTKEEGTGLGLSMVSRIVEGHKGVLRFSSKQGSGTTFEIVLPVKG